MWGFCSPSAPKKGKSFCRLDISPTGARFKPSKSFHKGHIKGRLSAAGIQICSLSWQWTQMLPDAPNLKPTLGTSAMLVSAHLWQEYSLWLSYIVIKWGWPFSSSTSTELFITSNNIGAIWVHVYTHTRCQSFYPMRLLFHTLTLILLYPTVHPWSLNTHTFQRASVVLWA